MEDIERLAQTVTLHGLTRLEYEHDGVRIVLEKTVAVPAAAVAQPAVAVSTASPSADSGLAVGSPAAAGGPAAAATASQTATAAAPNAAATAAGAAGAATAPATPDATLVSAPLVGIAYCAKDPTSAPFVSPGDKVEKGAVLCLIEAMKMFNEVKAPLSGVVLAVHFEDGKLVEHGAPLFSIA